jgi:hypothetical protein
MRSTIASDLVAG